MAIPSLRWTVLVWFNCKLVWEGDSYNIIYEKISRVIAEPSTLPPQTGKLTGMNESSATVTVAPENTSSQPIGRKVVSVANVGVVPSGQDNILR